MARLPLLDTIVLALHEMKTSTKTRRALLIISDGGDNNSRYNKAEVRSLVRENDVLIYALGIYAQDNSAVLPEEVEGPGLLCDIAEQTGGRHLPVGDLNELPEMAAKIGIELRNRYMLGYSPTNLQRDGRYHHVQIKVVPPHGLPTLRASWRLCACPES
jgi:Ca-activated chloride channel homolog